MFYYVRIHIPRLIIQCRYMYSHSLSLMVDCVPQVPDLIDGLYKQLGSISNPQTRTGTLRCMRTLCTQFLDLSITHMLNMPLPWDR